MCACELGARDKEIDGSCNGRDTKRRSRRGTRAVRRRREGRGGPGRRRRGLVPTRTPRTTRGAAAPGRQPGALHRHELDRRSGARHGGRGHRGADHGARRRVGARPDLQPARRADRPEGPRQGGEALPDPPLGSAVRRAGDEHQGVRDRHQGGRFARPLPARRQGRAVRRRRRRQDGADPGADPQHRHASTAACRSSAAWASAHARATTSGVEMEPSPGVHRQDGARVRPDERAARRSHARRARRADDGRVLPRRSGGQDVLLFIDNIFRFVQAVGGVGAAAAC